MKHDNSKFFDYEWNNLVNMKGKKDIKKLTKVIEVHCSRNLHHPENRTWDGINNMDDIHLAEMVCDWYARSCEKGQSFDDWIFSGC